eukprot:s2087_g5.t1
MTAMDLSKEPKIWELVKAVVDDFVALKIHYLISNVPTYLDWLVEYLSNDLLPRYRQEHGKPQLKRSFCRKIPGIGS